MGALGAWLGATYTVVVFILSGFLAALFGAAVLTAAICTKGVAGVRRRYWTRATDAPPPKKGKPRSAEDRKIRRRLLPYALPVALSTWGVLIWQVLQAQN